MAQRVGGSVALFHPSHCGGTDGGNVRLDVVVHVGGEDSEQGDKDHALQPDAIAGEEIHAQLAVLFFLQIQRFTVSMHRGYCISSLGALLTDRTVSVFSVRRTRLEFIADIDVALEEVEAAYESIKAAIRSPVKKVLNLLRRASIVQPVLHDENATPSEIQLLQRALRTRRNSLVSVSALPTEVLTPILELCPTIAVDTPDFKTANFVRGVTLSHVCRRWREITLKSSTFWTHIVLSRPRWALEMLHCSRVAQLAVGADLGSMLPKHIAACDLVFAQLFRIRELRLHMAAQHIPAPLLLPAPILETFHLHFPGLLEFVVPANLFAAEVPRLRHLSLQYCSLQWDSPLWANLVSLELIHSPIHVNLLANMPHLRSLTLIESFLAMVDTEPVLLARLETLTLTGSSWLCTRFLQAISVPQSRIVLNTPYSAGHLRFVWDALERHRAEAAEPVICGLTFADRCLVSGEGAVFEVGLISNHSIDRSAPHAMSSAYPAPACPCPGGTTPSPPSSRSCRSTTSPRSHCSAKACGSPPRCNLRPFRSVAVHHDVAVFTSQFEGDPLMAAGDRFDVPAVHYPRLRKIAFHHVAFGDRHMETILDWLAQRKRLLLAIEEIRLVGCTLTTADYGSLKELVGCVYVEGG
ncbi:hypothetical protein B0H14DRAFT_3888981 [Mycena olivaceomarginata]|nr:hypothetical protein B0H14DRAFT_3888981 [Mycena olivaceomarginata]